jgi:rubredoxin/uncharacterized membrane protein
MKSWQCTICKYIHKGDTPPERCPVCGAHASKFIEIKESPSPEQAPPPKKTVVKPIPDNIKKESIQKPVKESASGVKETGFSKITSLLVQHHAHPISVHSPNGIVPVVAILFVLAWIFGYDLLSKVAFINMIFVVLALPLVVFTGIIEWKKKYNGALTLIFKLKILAVTITTITCVISLVWYLLDPAILSSPRAGGFISINIIMLIAVGIAGHIGGKLVFKD